MSRAAEPKSADALCHCHPTGTDAREGVDTVVLAGNPNVGKSVVFAALTGTYVDVSNFPGTTVELTRGRFGEIDVIDTPGVYGVSSFNDEERVARDIIMTGDVVINVVDAVHLERDLFLTLQLVDMGKRMVVALNMADEARKRGLAIDRDLLEDLLGVPVIETVAVEGKGFDELKAAIDVARTGHSDHSLEGDLVEMAARVGTRAEALMVLEGDEVVSERHGVEPGSMRDTIYLRRRDRVNDICHHVISETTQGATFSARLSQWMMHPATGIPMLLGLLYLMWVVLGQWIAGGLVGFLEETIMLGYWVPFVERIVGAVFAQGSAMYTILAGEFGVLTMTPTYLLAVILPLVAGFYLLLSLLEDSGYLPRIAALADRSLTAVGLNGRAIIPLILGLGCVTMGTLTTRILGSKRERFIATALMAIAVPCSAQIAVIAGLMARTGALYSAMYVGFLFLVFGAVGAVLNRLVPGTSTDLLDRPAEPAGPAPRQRGAQVGHEGVALHEGGHAVLRGRCADHLGVAGDRRARLDHHGRRTAHGGLAAAARRGCDRVRDGLRAPRLRRDRLLLDEPDRRPAAGGHDHHHALRALHRKCDGHPQGARLGVFRGVVRRLHRRGVSGGRSDRPPAGGGLGGSAAHLPVVWHGIGRGTVPALQRAQGRGLLGGVHAVQDELQDRRPVASQPRSPRRRRAPGHATRALIVRQQAGSR